MDFSSINWIAVVACVVFSMISGSIWFGPKTFFPIWWKAIGMKEDDAPNGSPLTWVLLIVASFIQAVSVSLMVKTMGSTSALSGAMAGFMLWLGFVAPTGLVNKLFPGYLKAWIIEAGHHLINFLAFGAILGVWH